MLNPSQVRIREELHSIEKDPPYNATISLVNQQNIYEWEAAIVGPNETPYEDGVFFLNIRLPPEYPKQPPKVNFTTKIYHLNINSEGQIKINYLEEKHWVEFLTISKVMKSIYSLLVQPDTTNAYEKEQLDLFLKRRQQYDRMARQWTQKYAK